MIHINHLSFSYNSNDQSSFQLKEINLNVKENENYGIIGLSGSGKSTLLKCIANIFEPQSGSISLQNQNISMVFQQNALFDSMTVYENLAFPLNEFKKTNSDDIIFHFLESVGLKEHINKTPSELSGGMRKRLGIIRSLIIEPKILLYDEPTAGLDPITSHKITTLIQELNLKNKITSIIVSSDFLNLQRMTDRMGILVPMNGSSTLLDLGESKNIYNIKNEYLNQFIKGLSTGPLTA